MKKIKVDMKCSSRGTAGDNREYWRAINFRASTSSQTSTVTHCSRPLTRAMIRNRSVEAGRNRRRSSSGAYDKTISRRRDSMIVTLCGFHYIRHPVDTRKICADPLSFLGLCVSEQGRAGWYRDRVNVAPSNQRASRPALRKEREGWGTHLS